MNCLLNIVITLVIIAMMTNAMSFANTVRLCLEYRTTYSSGKGEFIFRNWVPGARVRKVNYLY